MHWRQATTVILGCGRCDRLGCVRHRRAPGRRHVLRKQRVSAKGVQQFSLPRLLATELHTAALERWRAHARLCGRRRAGDRCSRGVVSLWYGRVTGDAAAEVAPARRPSCGCAPLLFPPLHLELFCAALELLLCFCLFVLRS